MEARISAVEMLLVDMRMGGDRIRTLEDTVSTLLSHHAELTAHSIGQDAIVHGQSFDEGIVLSSDISSKSTRDKFDYNAAPWPSREELKVLTEHDQILTKFFANKGASIDFKLVTYKAKFDIWISAILQREGGKVYEPEMIRNLYQPEFEKKGVLEVGTNIGTLSTPVALLLKGKGHVIGIEANPENFKIASSNALINDIDNLWLFNNAVVRDSSIHKELNFKCDAKNRGHCTLLDKSGESLDFEESWMHVPTITIDELYERYPEKMCDMGVMKVDVEGYEGQVLQGAKKYLTDCPVKKLYLELNQEWLEAADTPVEQILELLEDAQYIIANKYTGFGNYEFTHCSFFENTNQVKDCD